MFTLRLKYCLFCSLLSVFLQLRAQEPYDGNQAGISIIGNDPVQSNNVHDFINTNPYDQHKAPPDQKQRIQKNQNIEPTLENGFHMRFEVSAFQPIEQMGSSSFSSLAEDYGNKDKKRGVRPAGRIIKIKKYLKRMFPTRKKKYRPTLCGRF